MSDNTVIVTNIAKNIAKYRLEVTTPSVPNCLIFFSLLVIVHFACKKNNACLFFR